MQDIKLVAGYLAKLLAIYQKSKRMLYLIFGRIKKNRISARHQIGQTFKLISGWIHISVWMSFIKKGRISGKALVIIAFPGGGVFVSHSFVLQAYKRVISKRKVYWIEILIVYNTFVSLLCFIQCFCFNLQHVLQVHFHL